MMNTILQHRSIRKYKDTKLSESLLKEILEAGIRASNTGNMQVYSMIVTQNPEIKDQLWAAHFKQELVKQAPVVITFCADINRFNRWCEARDAHPAYDNFLWLYNATIDAVLASQNVALAAEDKGLGICYLGTTCYMADRFIEILKLPKGVVPVTAITVGYPDESPGLTDRLPLDAVVHYETYKEYQLEDINRLYAEKEALKETLELVKINDTENLAQIFTDKRYVGKDNKMFSEKFLKTLYDQGFMNNDG